MRYVERSTPFACADVKTYDLLDGGTLFGLKRCGEELVPAFALSPLTLLNIPAAAQRAYLSAKGNLYLYGDGAVYRSMKAYANFIKPGVTFAGVPSFTEVNGGEMLVYDGQTTLRVTSSLMEPINASPVVNGAFHYSRLFGVDSSDEYTIRWSAPDNVRQWTEELNGAGHMRLPSLRGGVLRLISYDGKLVAVRRYGLTLLRIYGDVQDFRVEVTDTDTDEMVEGTAIVCAGKLMFFTVSGLYAFESKVKAYAKEQLGSFVPSGSVAAWGNVLLACGQLEGRGVIACIDCENEEVSYIELAATCVCAAGSAFCFCQGTVYEIVRGAGGGAWESGPCNFGSCAEKYLESVDVDGTAESLSISSGNRQRTFHAVSGRVKVDMTGREFTFRADCENGLKFLCARYAVRR